MDYEVEGARPRGRPLGERLCKKTWACKLNREDAMDRNTPWAIKKRAPFIFSITLANIDGFS